MNRRDEIINFTINTKLLTTCVDYQLRKQPQHYPNRDDIIQDAWMWLLTYNLNKLWDAYTNKHLNAIITRYIQNQLFSKTSEYYRKYVKLNNLTDEIENYAEGEESDI